MSEWTVRDRFLETQTRWLTLIGEHLETDQGETLEYWRVERADSVIVLPLLAHTVLLPEPMYRPGIGKATLDFPGGRIDADQTPQQAAIAILHRELAVDHGAIATLTALNTEGWPINSSFSNQRLYGYVAELSADWVPSVPCLRYRVDAEGLADLSHALVCLQCRAVLREWQVQSCAAK